MSKEKRRKPPAPPPRRGPLQQRAEITTSSRAFPRMKAATVPRRGWIHAIRTALGVSQSQLAARMGVARATVQQMERAEARRRITLASLDRLSHAMGCQVAVAIVPQGGTLDDVRRRQARVRAEELLKEKLEASERAPPRPRELERRHERLAAKLLRGSPRRLWKTEPRPKPEPPPAPPPPLKTPPKDERGRSPISSGPSGNRAPSPSSKRRPRRPGASKARRR